MLLRGRFNWALALFIGLLVLVNMVLIIAVFRVASMDRQELYRDLIRQDLGSAITNIVDRIIEDVGLREVSKNEDSGPEKVGSSDRMISADISTMGRSVWLNGRRFELGSFISPYGVIVEIGNDVAVVVDLDGVRRLIARPLPSASSVAESLAGKTVAPSGTADKGGPHASAPVAET